MNRVRSGLDTATCLSPPLNQIQFTPTGLLQLTLYSSIVSEHIEALRNETFNHLIKLLLITHQIVMLRSARKIVF